jgi:hypothetical protein
MLKRAKPDLASGLMIDCRAWHFRQDRNVLDRDHAMLAGRLGVIELRSSYQRYHCCFVTARCAAFTLDRGSIAL